MAKTIKVQLNVWQDELNGAVHISSDTYGWITTVNAKEGSPRHHEKLWQHLVAALAAEGKIVAEVETVAEGKIVAEG